jgi:hypothetical protein
MAIVIEANRMALRTVLLNKRLPLTTSPTVSALALPVVARPIARHAIAINANRCLRFLNMSVS